MMERQSFFSSFLFLFSMIIAIQSTQVVDITYSSSGDYDKLNFLGTNNIQICSKVKATYVTNSWWRNTVSCKCPNKQTYFSKYGKETECQIEAYGKLYGCECTEKICSNPLTESSGLIHLWKFSNVASATCHPRFSRFTVSVWDGKIFVLTPKLQRDFAMTVDSSSSIGNAIVEFRWRSPRPSFIEYQGRLIKFDYFCGLSVKRCFVMKGEGTHTISIDPLTQPTKLPEVTKKNTKKTNAPVIGGVVGGVVLISSIAIFYFCRRRCTLVPSVQFKVSEFQQSSTGTDSSSIQLPPYTMGYMQQGVNPNFHNQPAPGVMIPNQHANVNVISTTKKHSVLNGLNKAGKIARVINKAFDVEEEDNDVEE